MYLLLTLVSLLAALGSFYFFQQNGNTLLLVVAIVCAILFLIFGALFMSGKVNKSEDIHITE